MRPATCRWMFFAAFATVVTVRLSTAPVAAEPRAEYQETSAVLVNDSIRCEFSWADGHWRMARLSRPDGSAELKLDADPLGIVIYEGEELTAEDFRVEAVPARPGRQRGIVTAKLVCEEPPITAVLRYWLTDDDPYLRKIIIFREQQDATVDELRVLVARTELPLRGGGKGLPVFVGDAWWFGVEYPAFFAAVGEGGFVLKHYPGRALEKSWQSRTFVCGVAPAGLSVELAFDDYVQGIKRPSRSFLQYNSWYDVRNEEMTLETFRRKVEAFEEHLLEPYGLTMDSYQPDDGWQDPQSVWEPRKDIYPEGFRPLAELFQAHGSRMGLWMPLFGVKLDIDWAREQGYEVSNRGRSYCIAGPKSFEAMQRATRRHIQECNLAYYKHDFNALHCSAEGHGHLPTDRHGYEANMDAEIRLLAYERELKPDIFLNVTSSVWLSPWWLQHADTIWMCASDFGFDRTFPQLSPREWAMSYRDAHFHRVYIQQHNPTPLSALMTHGIIKGKRNRLGGKEETLREWADYVALYYGRGVLLKELYVSPELLDEDQWRALGTSTRWAVDNWRTLQYTKMFGGDPRKGQPYGYAHFSGTHGIIALRNPSYRAMTLRVPVDESTGYRGDHEGPFAVREIYPAHRGRSVKLTAGGKNEITLPPCSVALLELRPDAGWPTETPPRAQVAEVIGRMSGSAELEADAQGAAKLSISLPAMGAAHERLDLYVILNGMGVKSQLVGATVNGEKTQARMAPGEDWVIYSYDLRARLDQAVEYQAGFAEPGDQPFATRDVRVEAWLVGKAGERTDADPFADEHLPWAIGQGCEGYSVQLLPATEVPRPEGPTITAEELANIKAAKLRMEVFDVNPEERYQPKHILLNGTVVAEVPANRGHRAAWQEQIIDLKGEQLGLVRMENTLVLTNAGGDCYKFRGLALAVQRKDGVWVETDASERVLSSVGGWLYTEGDLFEGNKSPEVRLALPEG